MPRKDSAISIVELETKSQFESIYPLIAQINPDMTKKEFKQLLKEMLEQNYRCIAAYKGKKLVGICGMWCGTRFWCGRFIDVDNVVVDKSVRGQGVGALMMKWVEKEAKKQKANHVGADSYTKDGAAHRFYFRERFTILGYHFVRKLRRSR
ncbi:MAG: GNAT family N-acetyltransferase [Rickettsiales bacterium]